MRFVAEITLVVDPSGTEQTFYVATSGFATMPSDTPASTHIAGRLKNPGRLSRSLFSGPRVTGQIRPSYGIVSIWNGDGALDAWGDYAVSGGRVIVRMGDEDAAYPAGYTTVYVAYIHRMHAALDSIELHLKDRLDVLDKPFISRGFAGSGGLEGASGAAGKLRQWVSESPGYIPPTLINGSSLLYFVQSTKCVVPAAIAVYEGGVAITRAADYPSSAMSGSPLPGECKFYVGAEGVYFRLGSVPVYELRVLTSGAQDSGASWTVPAIAALGGISGGSGSLAALDLMVDDDRTFLDVLDGACVDSVGWYGMTRLDAFRCGALAAPTGSPVLTLTQHNARDWQRVQSPGTDVPVWRVTLNAGRTWPCSLAAAASSTLVEALSRSPWRSSFVSEDSAILTANPGAEHAVVDTPHASYFSPFSHGLFATKYFDLFGVRRSVWRCTVEMTADTLATELHDVVMVKLPRYGHDSGRLYRVVEQDIDCAARRITYGLWG